jgi:hypothetical protein
MPKIETGTYSPGYNYIRIFSKFFYRRTTVTIAIILSIVYLFYAWVVFGSGSYGMFSSQGEELIVLDLRFGYSQDNVYELFEYLGDNGLAAYRKVASLWDNIYPIIYSLVFIAWFSLLFKNFIPGWQRFKSINMLPGILLLTDWLENTFTINLIDMYIEKGTVDTLLVKFASITTMVKWLVLCLLLLILVIGASILLLKRIRKS